MQTLQVVNMSSYLNLRKSYLNFLKDSMSQDSLVGLTVSTLSNKKEISCVCRVSLPSVLLQHT
jgi:hypothetical protein